jgi:hypothetical protein
MRAFDMALAALALRTSAVGPPSVQRRLVPAVDHAGRATLDRNALDQQRAAMIASLWPEASACAVPARFAELPAPAVFLGVFQLAWRAPLPADDALALQARLRAVFPPAASAAARVAAQAA